MATEEEARRTRRRLGYLPDDDVSLSQEEVDLLFEDASVRYTNASSIEVYAAIVYLEGLFTSSAKMTTYRKNHTEIKASDLFNHIKELIAYYKGDLQELELSSAGADGAVRSGKTSHQTRINSVYWDHYL